MKTLYVMIQKIMSRPSHSKSHIYLVSTLQEGSQLTLHVVNVKLCSIKQNKYDSVAVYYYTLLMVVFKLS